MSELRKYIRATLSENRNRITSSSEKREMIEVYVNERLEDFCREVKQLAVDNEYPYINYHLNSILRELRDLISKNEYKFLGIEELYL